MSRERQPQTIEVWAAVPTIDLKTIAMVEGLMDGVDEADLCDTIRDSLDQSRRGQRRGRIIKGLGAISSRK